MTTRLIGTSGQEVSGCAYLILYTSKITFSRFRIQIDDHICIVEFRIQNIFILLRVFLLHIYLDTVIVLIAIDMCACIRKKREESHLLNYTQNCFF